MARINMIIEDETWRMAMMINAIIISAFPPGCCKPHGYNPVILRSERCRIGQSLCRDILELIFFASIYQQKANMILTL